MEPDLSTIPDPAALTVAEPSGYLFLDVDGVLNPVSPGSDGDWVVREDIGLYGVWTSATLGRWLNDLIENDVQIVWATTWIFLPDDLDALAASLGLHADLPRIDDIDWDADDLSFAESGKRPGIKRFLARHDIDPRVIPVVWADDDLGDRDLRYARSAGIHAIKVPPQRGLDDAAQRRRIEDALRCQHHREDFHRGEA